MRGFIKKGVKRMLGIILLTSIVVAGTVVYYSYHFAVDMITKHLRKGGDMPFSIALIVICGSIIFALCVLGGGLALVAQLASGA